MCTENIALHAEYTDNMCREKRENKNIQVSFSCIPYMGQIENASLITYSTLLRKSNTLQYLIMDDVPLTVYKIMTIRMIIGNNTFHTASAI